MGSERTVSDHRSGKSPDPRPPLRLRSIANGGRRRPSFVDVHFRFNFAVCGLALLVLAHQSGRTMFGEGLTDGFTSQIETARVAPIAGQGGLELVHFVRYVAVWPFYEVETHTFGALLQMMMLLAVLAPIVLYRPTGSLHSGAQFLPLALPLVFSFRAVLVMAGMAYLYLYLFERGRFRKYRYLLLSALLCNLSSGAVVIWIVIVAVSSREIIAKTRVGLAVFLVMAASLSTSLVSKIEFSENLLTRNTILVSIQDGLWLRAAFYLVLCSAVALICLTSGGLKNPYGIFFLAALPLFLFEGLGPASFAIPAAWHFIFHTGTSATSTPPRNNSESVGVRDHQAAQLGRSS